MKKLSIIDLLLILMLFSSPAFAGQDASPVSAMKLKQKAFGLQMPFIENHGQVKDTSVLFYADTFAGPVFVTDKGEMVYGLTKPEARSQKSEAGRQQEDLRRITAISERLEGCKQAKIAGVNKSETRVNYLIGGKDNWKTGIETWRELSLGEVYDNIELKLIAYGDNVEKIFTVRPEGSVSDIRLKVDGAKGLRVNESGELEVDTEDGIVRFSRPIAYQEMDGKRVEISVEYRVKILDSEVMHQEDEETSNSISAAHGPEFAYAFSVGDYDHLKPLVIDPVLSYSTYLGGNGTEGGYSIATDSAGNAYVTGSTGSTDFPVENPFQATTTGSDVFVTKINTNGTAIVYSTYLGGTGSEVAWGIAVDSSGNAYVTGETGSTNFPVLNPLRTNQPLTDAFVTKLSTDGSALVYSTYLGGNHFDMAYAIAVDSSGNAYVTGITESTDFPVENPLQSALSGGFYLYGDIFLTKINANGTEFGYSTYLGGTGTDEGFGIAVDPSGNVYLTGRTNSTDFPLFNAFQTTRRSYYDSFVSKINPEGSALVYSTYLGGTGNDYGKDVAADQSGNAYVTGCTRSLNFPLRNPIKGSINTNDYDAFVSKFDPTGMALVYSTYLGGTGRDEGNGIAVDSSENVYVAGTTSSTNFPVINPIQPALSSANYEDVFVSKIVTTQRNFRF